MKDAQEIRSLVRNYLLENFLDAGSASELTDSTPLITGGILDSISTLKLISFLEETFHIELQPHEIDQDNFNTISAIVSLLQSKLN